MTSLATTMSPSRTPSLPDWMDKVFTATALGLVGTGRTPQAARTNLMEKIRQGMEV